MMALYQYIVSDDGRHHSAVVLTVGDVVGRDLRPPLTSRRLLESVGHWESGGQHVEDYRFREDYQARRTCVLLKHRCDRCEHDEQGVNELTQNAQKPLSPAASA